MLMNNEKTGGGETLCKKQKLLPKKNSIQSSSSCHSLNKRIKENVPTNQKKKIN